MQFRLSGHLALIGVFCCGLSAACAADGPSFGSFLSLKTCNSTTVRRLADQGCIFVAQKRDPSDMQKSADAELSADSALEIVDKIGTSIIVSAYPWKG